MDQGSGAEIMSLNLYKGLGLRPNYLSKYDTSLVGFDGESGNTRGTNKTPRSDQRKRG